MEDDLVEGEYDAPGLMRTDSLAETFNPNGFFDGEVTPQAAKIAVAQFESLEKILKATEQYGEKASEFCVAEAMLWKRIADAEGAESKLTASQKDTVEWVRRISDDKWRDVLSMCQEGRRLRSIINAERREHISELKQQTADKEYKRIQDKIVSDLRTNGHTKLTASEFVEQWRALGPPNKDTIKAYVESTRDKLLKSGGRGLGDGDGTYMLPPACSRKNIEQIVQTRINSIYRDIGELAKICKDADFYVPREGLRLLHEAVDGLGDDDE